MEEKRLGGPWWDKDGNYHTSTQICPKINLFENAYFGKPYKTRDNRKAVYLKDNTCWVEDEDHEHGYCRNGKFGVLETTNCGIDIVSEWHEEINEEELDKFATDADCRMATFYNTCGWTVDDYYREGFKAGYRKAKEY